MKQIKVVCVRLNLQTFKSTRWRQILEFQLCLSSRSVNLSWALSVVQFAGFVSAATRPPNQSSPICLKVSLAGCGDLSGPDALRFLEESPAQQIDVRGRSSRQRKKFRPPPDRKSSNFRGIVPAENYGTKKYYLPGQTYRRRYTRSRKRVTWSFQLR